MKIIPVIDVLNGVVVHAVKGERSQYKPLQSRLVSSVQPVEVAKAFCALGFGELYFADLTAITVCSSDFELFGQIAQTGLKLMVDAGITSIARAQMLIDRGVSRLVVGTETLSSCAFVGEAVERFGGERVVVSLDLRAGVLLSKAGFGGSIDPVSLLQEFEGMGVGSVIVLDLARVGSGLGLDNALINAICAKTSLEVYVGGGVRGMSDLVELRSIGVAGVLVATALHSGNVSVAALRSEGFL